MHRSGHKVFSGTNRRKIKSDVSAMQVVGTSFDVAVRQIKFGAHRGETGDVHINRSSTEVVAAWHIESHVAFARQQWAEQIDRRTNRLDQFRRRDRFHVATIG